MCPVWKHLEAGDLCAFESVLQKSTLRGNSENICWCRCIATSDMFSPQICDLSLIVGLIGNEKNIKKKKRVCLLHASKDLSVLSPNKGWRKELVSLCYPLPLKENPHGKGALQEKETENKEDFQRSPGSSLRRRAYILSPASQAFFPSGSLSAQFTDLLGSDFLEKNWWTKAQSPDHCPQNLPLTSICTLGLCLPFCYNKKCL